MDIMAIAHVLGYNNKQLLCDFYVYDLLDDLINDNNSYISKLPREIMNEMYNKYLCKTHDVFNTDNDYRTLCDYIVNNNKQLFLMTFFIEDKKCYAFIIVRYYSGNTLKVLYSSYFNYRLNISLIYCGDSIQIFSYPNPISYIINKISIMPLFSNYVEPTNEEYIKIATYYRCDIINNMNKYDR